MSQQHCLLLESSSLFSLDSYLDSINWQTQAYSVEEGQNLPEGGAFIGFSAGIIRSHTLTPTVITELTKFASQLPDIDWILITHEDNLAENHVKNFVCEYCCFYLPESISKPFISSELKTRLKVLLEQGQAINQLKHAKQSTPQASNITSEAALLKAAGIVTRDCESMKKLAKYMAKASITEAPVLILGESGTGKELIAKGIHQQSTRADEPFIAINCGAIPDTLIQSELFGCEQGAFTGANKRRIGKIEQAQNGTLFLDEIAELPLALQVNLLRFLQEKTIERLGGGKPIKLNVRVIAATHNNLEQAVEQGTFREDLYYRLAVLQLVPPPLRERGKDICFLAEHFLKIFSTNINKASLPYFSDRALAALSNYHWPGNIRELMNRVQSAALISEGPSIETEDIGLPSFVPQQTNNTTNIRERNILPLEETKRIAEIQAINHALEKHSHNISQASRKLKISRASMYRLMHKYKLG